MTPAATSMARPVATAVALLLLAPRLGADDWPGPRPSAAFSEDGTRFVRVTPGTSLGDTVGFAGAERGAFARAAFYRLAEDRSYRLVADVALQNPMAPVDLLLSDDGYLVTFDNWHNVGYGKAIAIYGPDGQPVASWELEQLYAQEQLAAIPTSVSSRWWRCAPFHFVDPDEQTKVYVREALGGYFVLDLASGTFEYTAGTADCTPPSGPFSTTSFG